MWLSEEIDANDWDHLERSWALPVGVTLNLIFLIARANSKSSGRRVVDDVFGEEAGVPWLSWLVRLFWTIRAPRMDGECDLLIED